MIAEFEQHCTCLQLCSIHVPLPIYVPGVVPGSMFCNAEEPFFDTHTQQQGPQLPGISLGPKCSGGCTNLCSGGCANYVPGVVPDFFLIMPPHSDMLTEMMMGG